MNILAFDLGASGGKLFLAKIDGDNVSIENIHRFDNVSYSANGALFWDIINIYKEMNVGIKKAIEMTDDQIDSFAIDSFSNDFASAGVGNKLAKDFSLGTATHHVDDR